VVAAKHVYLDAVRRLYPAWLGEAQQHLRDKSVRWAAHGWPSGGAAARGPLQRSPSAAALRCALRRSQATRRAAEQLSELLSPQPQVPVGRPAWSA
jgi:hypothetical protein